MVFWGHIYCSSLIWAFTCSSAATVQTQHQPPHEFSHTASCHFKGAFSWPKFLSFPRIVITRKRLTNSTLWHHFWKAFESSFQNHFPDWKSDDFCGIQTKKSFFTLTVNFYCTRIAGQFDTYITSVFVVTHGYMQLVKPASVKFYQ